MTSQNENRYDPGPLTGLDPTPAAGRHAILPGVGLAPPDAVGTLLHHPSRSPDMPDLDIPGRLPEEEPHRIRRAPEAAPDTEALLNAMIGECHFLMKEVSFRCMVQAVTVEDRLSFMRSAMNFARTGAKVARTIGRLRALAVLEDERIQTLARKSQRRAAKKVRNPENQ